VGEHVPTSKNKEGKNLGSRTMENTGKSKEQSRKYQPEKSNHENKIEKGSD